MIHFQQESGPDFKRPWSVIVDDDGGVVHGRPDAKHLVGFTPKGDPMVPVLWKAALADPEAAVGLVPVFVGHDGKMFSVELAVVSCTEYEATAEQLAFLRAREAQMRDALDRVDDPS